jgi:hypothetical protein
MIEMSNTYYLLLHPYIVSTTITIAITTATIATIATAAI